MELRSVRTTKGDPGRIRIVGEMAYDDRPGRIEECWFDFPDEYAEWLCLSGSPWLACMLPLAARLGEPLRIPLPVDRLLYRNAMELVHIWQVWHPALRPVEVIAERVDESPAGGRAAAFFSGGIDAFFTLLRNADSRFPEALPLDDLIFVGGFDIPLKNLDGYFRLRETFRAVASRLDKRLVDVYTNLRETRLEEANWYDVLHGPAALSIGLMLGARYNRLMIASAAGYGSVEHSGTNALTDPLLSTSRTRVVHDGARFNRLQKCEFVGSSELAMSALHVCWSAGSDINCGACEKCVRTMVGLELTGHLPNCRTFPKVSTVAQLSRLRLGRWSQERGWKRTRRMARASGRKDIARAIGGCLRRSRIFRPLRRLAKGLQTRRFVWRLSGPLNRWLLKGVIK